jgi:CheY-like chemotaxis protein
MFQQKGKIRILIIEDEPGVLMRMVYLLTRAGCDVETVWNTQKECKLAQGNGSNIPGEITHPAFKGFCQLCQSFQGDFLFRPFNIANVIARKSGLFRQFLLAPMGFRPPGADGLPQSAVNSARRSFHNFP